MNCKVCGKLMRLVPAGVSKKTGQPYSSFEACPDRCKQPKVGTTNAGMEIIGDILADIQTKVTAILKIVNSELPTE